MAHTRKQRDTRVERMSRGITEAFDGSLDDSMRQHCAAAQRRLLTGLSGLGYVLGYTEAHGRSKLDKAVIHDLEQAHDEALTTYAEACIVAPRQHFRVPRGHPGPRREMRARRRHQLSGSSGGGGFFSRLFGRK